MIFMPCNNLKYNSTLLVAGDSFAEFPHSVYMPWDNTNRKIYKEGPSTHWCELWADSANLASISSGIGGSAIELNAHCAIHEIIQNPTITHCVFFVSQPFRTTIRYRTQTLNLRNKKSKKQYIKRFANWDDQWNKSSVDEYFLQPPNAPIQYGNNFVTIEEPLDDIHTSVRMDATTREQFLTKALSSLSSLGYICQSKGIKLLFTSGFTIESLWRDWAENIMECPIYNHRASNVPMSDISVRSHYNKQEHAQIYEHLKTTEIHSWLNK